MTAKEQTEEEVREQVIKDLAVLLDDYYLEQSGADPEERDPLTQKSIQAILSIPEILIKHPDQRLPTDKGVNIKFKANPELSMPAQKEIAETAIMAYRQAEQDMKGWVKIIQ